MMFRFKGRATESLRTKRYKHAAEIARNLGGDRD